MVYAETQLKLLNYSIFAIFSKVQYITIKVTLKISE